MMERLGRMKNRILTHMLVFMGVICSSALFAGFISNAATCGDYTYIVLSDGTAELIIYKGSDRTVTIPDEVDGIPVTTLYNRLFYNNRNIRSVTIPEGVKYIEDYVFGNCDWLSEVNLPTTLKKIGSGAFSGCTWLRSVTIPEEVTNIGSYAFSGCTWLGSVTIPGTVKSIESNVFQGCSDLYSVNILEGVTYINSSAFADCTSLSKVKLPKTISSVSAASFYGCTNLSAVNVDEDNGNYCSKNGVLYNKAETALIFYPPKHEIPSNGELILDNGITNIGGYAFFCSDATKITFPGSVTYIGANVFEKSQVQVVNIPLNVTDDLRGSLAGAFNLQEINVDGDNERYESIDGVLFDKFGGASGSEKTLLYYPSRAKRESYTIPDGVTSIDYEAFDITKHPDYKYGMDVSELADLCSLREIIVPDSFESFCINGCVTLRNIQFSDKLEELVSLNMCSSLQDVVIPKNIESIGGYVFAGCDNLIAVHFPEKLTSISDDVFSGCSANPVIYVVKNSYADDFFKNKGYTVRYDGLDSLFEYTEQGSGEIEITAYKGNEVNVDIPAVIDGKKVVSIGDDVFKNIDFLNSVSIPYGVKSIGDSAFSGCARLTSIVLPNGLTSIGREVFSGCRRLPSINLPEQLTELPDSAFYNCGSLQQITIPQNVTVMGDNVFYGCTALTEAEILGDIEEIGINTFRRCINLRSVNIRGELTCISEGMFRDCYSISYIEFPLGVTEVGAEAFYSCGEMVRVAIPDTYYPYGVVRVGENAFYGCNENLTIITGDPNDLYGYGYRGVVYDYAVANNINVRFFYEEYGYDYEILDTGGIIITRCNNKSDSILVIPDSIGGKPVEAINVYFYDYDNLTTVIMPNSVTSMGSTRFEDCDNLKEVKLPAHLKEISGGLFENCSSLERVVIPDEVTAIFEFPFCGCAFLKEIVIPQSVTYMDFSLWPQYVSKAVVCYVEKGSYAEEFFSYMEVTVEYITDTKCFSYVKDEGGIRIDGYYGNDGDLVIPQSINKLPVKAVDISFEGSDIITAEVAYGMELPAGVFADCTLLEAATLDRPLSSLQGQISLKNMVPDKAFMGCTKLESAIALDVKTVGESAFENCASLEDLTIMGNVSEIGKRAFYGCKSLTEFTCPTTLITLGEEAFAGCSSMESLILSDRLTEIPRGAFSGCTSLKQMEIPKRVTAIGDSAFQNCSGMTKLVIPYTVETIGENALLGCSSNLVCYVDVDSAAEAYVKEHGISYEYLTDTVFAWGNYKYKKCNNGNVKIVGYTRKDKVVTIPSIIDGKTVEGIDDEAFYRRSDITGITIPDTVEYIGNKAFYRCTTLAEVSLPDTCTVLGNSVFMDCGNLTSVKLPSGLQSIGHSAFSGCKRLEEISIPEKITVINTSTFSGCSMLSSIRLPEGMIELGTRAFYNCTGIRTMGLPETVTVIGDECFYGCQLLKSINIPTVTRSIGTRAFDFCDSELCLLVNRETYAVDYALENSISFKYADDIVSGSMQVDSVRAYTDDGTGVIEDPESISVESGKSLSIEIKAASKNNTVSYKWISEDGVSVNSTWSNSGRLDIVSMQPGMYGVLTCYMSDGVDMDAREFYIDSGLTLSMSAEKDGEALSGRDVTVDMGDEVTLRAIPLSAFDSEVSYAWEKDGVSLGITEPQITLTAAMKDSGTYTCTVTDGYTERGSSIKLTVNRKVVKGSLKLDSVKVYTDKGETVKENITDVVVAGKDSLEIYVKASSVNGDVTYKWVAPGEDGADIEWTDSGKLSVKEMNSKDYGTYSCYYTDGVDMSQKTFRVDSGITVSLKPYVNDAAVGQDALYKGEIEVDEGDSVRIDAVASSSVGSGLYYEWKKNGSKLDNITSGLPLVAEPDSEGTYICTVTDGYTEKSCSIKLDVNRKQIKGSLTLDYIEVYTQKGEKKQEDITDITVAGNDSLEIELAAVSRNGAVTYKWVPPGVDSASVEWTKSGKLSIGNMKKEDYGTYSCYYSDGIDIDQKTFRIDSGITADIAVSVNGALVEQSILDAGALLVMAGDRVSMETKAESSFGSALTYRWNLSNSPLEGNGAQYMMEKVTVKDGGTYECEVSDGFTSWRVSVAFKVAEPMSDISEATIEAIPAETYSGNVHMPVPKIHYGGIELKKDVDFVVEYPAESTNAGKKQLTVKGIGSYTGSKTVGYEIIPYDATIIDGIWLKNNKTKANFKAVYTGKPITLTESQLVIGIKDLGNMVLKPGIDYELEYDKNKDVGAALINVLFKGNITGKRTYQFEIIPPAPKLKSVKKKSNGLVLNWNKISCADGYYIYRSTKKDTGYKKLATVKKNKTVKYTDKKAKKGKKYYYKVVAFKKVSKNVYESMESDVKGKKR